ncbi:MAG: hypothetical protein M5U34_49220 [Chloroflexi bacterium]|nr:hypothetical protein [Chloroflexota bacterium]
MVEDSNGVQANIGGSITYQGQLTDGGSPAAGDYQFSFKLYDALAAGVQVGSTQTQILTVVDGLFTATPSFGDVFNGAALYLEIGVRPSGSPDPSPHSARARRSRLPPMPSPCAPAPTWWAVRSAMPPCGCITRLPAAPPSYGGARRNKLYQQQCGRRLWPNYINQPRRLLRGGSRC